MQILISIFNHSDPFANYWIVPHWSSWPGVAAEAVSPGRGCPQERLRRQSSLETNGYYCGSVRRNPIPESPDHRTADDYHYLCYYYWMQDQRTPPSHPHHPKCHLVHLRIRLCCSCSPLGHQCCPRRSSWMPLLLMRILRPLPAYGVYSWCIARCLITRQSAEHSHAGEYRLHDKSLGHRHNHSRDRIWELGRPQIWVGKREK